MTKMAVTGVAIALCTLHLAPVHAVEIDGIAANVNESSILRSEVLGEMARARVGEEDYPKVLDEIINRRLILRAAQDQKLQMQDWVVENRIREIIGRAFDGDRSRLMETLQKQRISYPEWYKRMREDMIISAMRYQTIDKNLSATPAELREEYQKNRAKYRENGELKVSVILLAPEDADKATNILEIVKSDPSRFAELAKTYSSDSHAEQGGVWDNFKPSQVFRPEVVKVINDLAIGGLSGWIDIDGWKFLIRKDVYVVGHYKGFAEAYDEIDQAVKNRKGEEMYQAWIKRLRNEAYIKVF